MNSFADAEWEAHVAGFPIGSFFHGSTWARVLAESYGFSPFYLRLGTPQAPSLLPIMEVNSRITGRRGVALPFTDECEPLAYDGQTFDALLRSVLDKLRARKWKYLELRGGASHLISATPSAKFFGHELQFNGPDAIAAFRNCTDSARGAVKKAEKSGVEVEITRRAADLDAFYSLVCQTRQRHGNPPQPLRFFRALHRHAIEPNSGLLLLARHSGVVVAGAIFLHSGRSAIYKYAASDARYRHLSANNLIFWRAMEWYIQHGYSSIQLGRTSLENDGLRRFKRSWGAREYQINYFRYSATEQDFVAGTDQSSGWQTRIFRALPLPLSRQIGALAYKHIA